MSMMDEGLAGLRQATRGQADAAPDWTTLEQAVIAGLHRHQERAQVRRQLAWSGALALVVGVAGGGVQLPWHGGTAMRVASPLALPAQAPSMVLMGAG